LISLPVVEAQEAEQAFDAHAFFSSVCEAGGGGIGIQCVMEELTSLLIVKAIVRVLKKRTVTLPSFE
jgi:hypothetical protein